MQVKCFQILICLFLFMGCSIGFRSMKRNPCHKIPQELINYESNLKSPCRQIGYEYKLDAWAIENKSHKDLFLTRRGIIKSKKYGWETDVHFNPLIHYENDNFFLVEVSSDISKLTGPSGTWWIVIRKLDGKIIGSFEQTERIIDIVICNDTLFLKLESDNRWHCLKIGE